jgi:hypothetical protein
MKLLYSQSRKSPFRDWPTQKRHAFEMQMTNLVRDELGKHSIVGSMKRVEVGDDIDSVYH